MNNLIKLPSIYSPDKVTELMNWIGNLTLSEVEEMKRNHKVKELTELQQVKIENRELRKQNSQLKKENKKLRREEHNHKEYKYEDDDYQQLPLFEEEQVLLCQSCFKGTLIEMNVVGRNWTYCNQCDYDSRHK